MNGETIGIRQRLRGTWSNREVKDARLNGAATLRSRTAGSQAETRSGAIHKVKFLSHDKQRLLRGCGARLEFDDDSGLGAEIVLGAVADYGGIAEAGANPVNVNGAEGDVFAEGDVETAADGEVEGTVVRDSTKVDTFALDGAVVVEVRVKIVVHPPEHNLRKRQD